MGTKRSWWQFIKAHPVATVLIAFFVALSVLVFLGGYKFNWDWTGFNRPSKTLWDWLQLLGVLAIPVVVGFGAVWFTTRQSKVADEENTDNQRETALQGYIDKMSELLLEKHLRDSAEEDEVRKIARVRTLTVLLRLDKQRKASVLRFLYESGLIHKGKSIVSLHQADLHDANLFEANLSDADLSGVDLSNAHLLRANLSDADLSAASLRAANLDGANLNGANLDSTNLGEIVHPNGTILVHGAHLNLADLSGAILSGASLSGAKLVIANLSDADLSGANLEKAILIKANLTRANLNGANLSSVDLGIAILKDVIGVTNEELENQAKSLKGATMPDGSIHP